MTSMVEYLPMSMDTNPATPAIDVWILVLPRFALLDATGPAQVFSTANDEARDAGRPAPYRIHMAVSYTHLTLPTKRIV